MSDQMYRKALTIVFLLASLLVGLVMGMGEKPAKSGSSIIDFELKDLNGKTHILSDYKGKMVFLNFWATWCPPCREEMPSMQKLYDTWDKKKFVMLAVNIEQGRDTVSEFAKENNYTFPILLDSDGSIARKYQVRGIPTTFLVNEQGQIVEKIVGSRSWSLKEIKSLFK